MNCQLSKEDIIEAFATWRGVTRDRVSCRAKVVDVVGVSLTKGGLIKSISGKCYFILSLRCHSFFGVKPFLLFGGDVGSMVNETPLDGIFCSKIDIYSASDVANSGVGAQVIYYELSVI